MLKNKEDISSDADEITIGNALEPHKQPMVFLFDIENSVVKELDKLRIKSFEGSLGAAIKVNNKPYEDKILKLDYDYPANLHEFDIVMLDLTGQRVKNYIPSQHQLNDASGNTVHALLSAYPEQVFDPRPLSVNVVARDLHDLFDKTSVIIAFCGPESISEYRFIEITGHGREITSQEKFSNYRFYQHLPTFKSRSGKKVKLPARETILSPLFLKHLDGIDFNAFFYHPAVWRNGESRQVENFVPLLLNEREEIVSYAHYVDNSVVLMFPDIADKSSFVSDLFKTYLPAIVPTIFPFHGEFKWLDSGEYPLPGEKELLQERVELEERFKRDIAENEDRISSLKVEYKFLSDLITETGEALVTAIEKYLRWLGFEHVINQDETNPDILEEDIQVDCISRFLVIEVKGIGGTSTDKDCSQINKIKYRRAEQRGKFDVSGLYIVNHQRYMPPKSRINPPFTDNQIKDAGHDKRGLLTTYELYKSYFMIENGILQKSYVRESLFKEGLITLEPENITSIGFPNELYMDGEVAILNLNNISISSGDTLVVKKQGNYSKVKVESLQVDGKGVEVCSKGEVGLKLNRKLKKKSELFVINI